MGGAVIAFTKMEGLGNDYVYVEAESLGDENWGAVAKEISDRHFGVGGDGLILILPSGVADARMAMYNADGSEGEMCGNGVRCIAKYLFDRRRIGRQAVVETKAGLVPVEIVEERPTRVRVDMGPPRLEPRSVPTSLGPGEVELPGAGVRGRALSMGNPHFVTFWGPEDEPPVPTLGPAIEHHPAFPERTNVEFAQVLSRDRVRLRVWERGSGETLACGTGASATVVAASLAGLTGPRATVHLLGGDLDVLWDDHVFITGPAREVFQGTYPRI